MLDAKCKICRRAGEKLFLKGDRCYTPKCAIVRKPYPPGIHGKSRGKKRRAVSEYGMQLRAKQKVKLLYELRERQFSRYVQKAMTHKTNTAVRLLELLEGRLDNVIFRLGFALSRSIARQIVGHGHIFVNGRKTTVPSYGTKVGDIITIRPASMSSGILSNLDIFLKKYKQPEWLSIDKNKKEGKILSNPLLDDSAKALNLNSIIEFYSR